MPSSLDVLEKAAVQANNPPVNYSDANSYGVARPSRIAEPGTLGLFSFASTTLILSLYNLGTRSISHPNVVVGMGLFCGGLAQLLAGMWEFPRGNAFSATAFTSFGAFWMSFATIFIPGSGISAAYTNADEFESALGIYLLTWAIFTFLLTIATLRKSIALITLFSFLTLTFILLAGGSFSGVANVTKAGGGIGVVTSLVAYYIGLSDLLSAEDQAVIYLPLGTFSKNGSTGLPSSMA
ncbi:FUN34 transmembrane protein [Laccaria bicolor S238N-H82]|uniref:FUN34 transmembrane protein n=1 Tax=Laccaria bicolor (strain S238N-H82 / ATCC MYA-4686) TaxID=486041 RepID=B0DTH1_LACBS|nr:FUN34 transmembrane protein [Laccaria bicolor S238N-H82]EDR02110.1 FUN34 transmembrane protein [Laccaria bicolor S238N-H82]|eukprot:XP_001887267.1 FUN34 transmembrane protein [Laccaria bicolor S238N-H82]